MWLLPGRTDTELRTREAAEPCKAAPERRQPGLVAPNDSWELCRHQVWILRGQALRNSTATGQAGKAVSTLYSSLWTMGLALGQLLAPQQLWNLEIRALTV